MLLIAGGEDFKLGVEIGLPELGFDAWHVCEEVVFVFWCLE